MILQILLLAFFTIFQAITSPLAYIIPEMPTSISDGGSWLITQISNVVGVVSMILSPPLLLAVVLTIGVLLYFERLYGVIRWILAKIPIGLR